jgi:hypothetical protein
MYSIKSALVVAAVLVVVAFGSAFATWLVYLGLDPATAWPAWRVAILATGVSLAAVCGVLIGCWFEGGLE